MGRIRRERLESYYQQVSAVILARQNPATGLVSEVRMVEVDFLNRSLRL
jgi:hypothetical protein